LARLAEKNVLWGVLQVNGKSFLILGREGGGIGLQDVCSN